jgi:hypothetical protein
MKPIEMIDTTNAVRPFPCCLYKKHIAAQAAKDGLIRLIIQGPAMSVATNKEIPVDSNNAIERKSQ